MLLESIVPYGTGMGALRETTHLQTTWKAKQPKTTSHNRPVCHSKVAHKSLKVAHNYTLRVQVPNHKVSTQNHNYDHQHGNPKNPIVRYFGPPDTGHLLSRYLPVKGFENRTDQVGSEDDFYLMRSFIGNEELCSSARPPVDEMLTACRNPRNHGSIV